ncbi:unnamed protein product [Sphacelaria rigidula]
MAGSLCAHWGGDAVTDLKTKTVDDLRNPLIVSIFTPPPVMRFQSPLSCVSFNPPVVSSSWSGENPACSVPALSRCEVNGLMTMACMIMSTPFPLLSFSFISVLKVSSCPPFYIYVPCMIQLIVDKLRPGLLENGRAVPRRADGVVSMPALQHVGRAADDFVDQHTVRVPPGGFLSLSPGADNVYAAYAQAEPHQRVQPYIDFRALLMRAAAAGGRSASDVQGLSYSPEHICALARADLRHLRQDGCYAMTLFEVIVVYATWFSAAARGEVGDARQSIQSTREGKERIPPDLTVGGLRHSEVNDGEQILVSEVREEAGGSGGDTPPPERTIGDLTKSDYRSISTFLWKVLAVAVGSTDTEFKMAMPSFMPLALYEDCPDEGAGRTLLRPFGKVAEKGVLYHAAPGSQELYPRTTSIPPRSSGSRVWRARTHR